MIHIGICDDNKYDINKIHNIITISFMDKTFEYQIHEYTFSQSFLDEFEQYVFDIVFLDIEIDEQDGISLSKKLQESQNVPYIIFITSHSSFMKDAFGYNVYKYILKDEIEVLLPKTLDSLINKLTQNTQLILPSEEGQLSLLYKDIHYIEYEDRKIFMKHKNQYIQLYISSLKKVFDSIDNSAFIYINNRYIVNMHYIQSMKEGIIIIDNLEIEIPKGKRKDVYQMYQKFTLEKYKHV
ncbi:MAG: LytTR family DNA-binding domain-containing protein [Coprobacillus sp.]